MFTKSLILQEHERINMLQSLEQFVSMLLEQYNVEDAVFGVRNGKPCEIIRGYFVERSNFDTLNEAIRHMNIEQGIRIHSTNSQIEYCVGDVVASVTECRNDEHVFDIELLRDVER